MVVWYFQPKTDQGKRAEADMHESVSAFLDAVGSVIKQVAPAKS
jgi:hypothetical protein